MKKPLLQFLLFLLLSFRVQAGLLGDYELIEEKKNENKNCPTGMLQLLENKKDQERALMFGASHIWAMKMSDRSSFKEKVPQTCTYEYKYNKTENSFSYITTRSKCSQKDSEGIVTEKIYFHDIELVYEFEFKDNKFKCRYKKIGK
jgi:hypothetical protein